MDGFMRALISVWTDSGFSNLTWENCVMILVGLVLLYLSIAKEYEPLLLLPIAFGCIMANFPNTGFNDEMGVMMAIGFGIKYEIFPPLIFMGVGAMTDFGPLLANPKTMLLGAAAQIGVFVALAGAMMLGFNVQQASAIGIIGGADGPTAIYLASKLAPDLLGAIAVAAYSYMSLVPLIQPPIMKLMTTKEQRKIKMVNLRPVSHFEKITEAQTSHQRRYRRQKQGYDDGYDDREYHLFKVTYRTKVDHLDLSLFLGRHQLHNWGLDERNQGHVAVCRHGNST